MGEGGGGGNTAARQLYILYACIGTISLLVMLLESSTYLVFKTSEKRKVLQNTGNLHSIKDAMLYFRLFLAIALPPFHPLS